VKKLSIDANKLFVNRSAIAAELKAVWEKKHPRKGISTMLGIRPVRWSEYHSGARNAPDWALAELLRVLDYEYVVTCDGATVRPRTVKEPGHPYIVESSAIKKLSELIP
jgi:hypothetical protein